MAARSYRVKNSSLHTRRPDGTVVILSTEDESHAFELDGLAAEIWTRLSNGEEFERIRAWIIATQPHHQKKLDRLITRLLSLGLIERSR